MLAFVLAWSDLGPALELSVYGMIKPSVATAGEKTGQEWKPNPIPITGQTKKPGSHRS